MRALFVGREGIRTGWRLAIFVVLVGVTSAPLTFYLAHRPLRWLVSPMGNFTAKALTFGSVLLASWVMARIERRHIEDYGLPLRPGFGTHLVGGLALGLAAISLLVGALWAVGAAHFAVSPIPLQTAVAYAVLWGGSMFATALAEEYLTRGYPLVTLARGIGFWPAAIVLSLAFGALHLGNPGETPLGIAGTVLLGLVFCYSVRATGSLWLAVGVHAAWNWGETFLYGVPNSGLLLQGHALQGAFAGPAWLTGGSAGPEGSLLALPVIGLLFVGIRRARPAASHAPH